MLWQQKLLFLVRCLCIVLVFYWKVHDNRSLIFYKFMNTLIIYKVLKLFDKLIPRSLYNVY